MTSLREPQAVTVATHGWSSVLELVLAFVPAFWEQSGQCLGDLPSQGPQEQGWTRTQARPPR